MPLVEALGLPVQGDAAADALMVEFRSTTQLESLVAALIKYFGRDNPGQDNPGARRRAMRVLETWSNRVKKRSIESPNDPDVQKELTMIQKARDHVYVQSRLETDPDDRYAFNRTLRAISTLQDVPQQVADAKDATKDSDERAAAINALALNVRMVLAQGSDEVCDGVIDTLLTLQNDRSPLVRDKARDALISYLTVAVALNMKDLPPAVRKRIKAHAERLVTTVLGYDDARSAEKVQRRLRVDRDLITSIPEYSPAAARAIIDYRLTNLPEVREDIVFAEVLCKRLRAIGKGTDGESKEVTALRASILKGLGVVRPSLEEEARTADEKGKPRIEKTVTLVDDTLQALDLSVKGK